MKILQFLQLVTHLLRDSVYLFDMLMPSLLLTHLLRDSVLLLTNMTSLFLTCMVREFFMMVDVSILLRFVTRLLLDRV